MYVCFDRSPLHCSKVALHSNEWQIQLFSLLDKWERDTHTTYTRSAYKSAWICTVFHHWSRLIRDKVFVCFRDTFIHTYTHTHIHIYTQCQFTLGKLFLLAADCWVLLLLLLAVTVTEPTATSITLSGMQYGRALFISSKYNSDLMKHFDVLSLWSSY